MRPLSLAAATFVLAASAFGQIPLPPHSSVYIGGSRGFNFTASTSFLIRRLDLPPEAYQAGDTAVYMVRVNGAEILRSAGNAGVISLASPILVTPGDVVDILGNWSPASPGNASAHNSYGLAAPYPTTIEGVPHTLYAIGWHWDIASPSYTYASYIPPASGPIGRVLVYTSTLAGYAHGLPYGEGCGGDEPASFYEGFGSSRPFDLGGGGVLMRFTGNGYSVVPSTSALVTPTSTWLRIGNDQTLPITLPWPMPYVHGTTSTIWLCSNGWISLEPTTSTDNTESVAELLGGTARVCAMWDHLDPSFGGTVHAEQDPSKPGLFRISFTGVPEWGPGLSTGWNTFQVTLSRTGTIEVHYFICTARGLVGYSPGGGAHDPGPTDLSAITSFVTGDDRLPLALVTTARPILGVTGSVETRDIPSQALGGVLLAGAHRTIPPVDLSPVGMPGCSVYQPPDVLLAFAASGSSVRHAIPIPNDPGLAGVHVYLQSAIAAPGVNPLGIAATNGIDWTLDLN